MSLTVEQATPSSPKPRAPTRDASFKGVGGLNIFARSWHPPGPARAVLIFVHGFNSHSGYYVKAAEELTAAGLAVYALDHRGRGRSEGERFYVESFSQYVDDLAIFVKLVKSRERGLPVFMLGHSAGGVISCAYALSHPVEIAGLVCESFAFQVPAPEIALSVLKGISHVAPHVHVLKLPNEKFSRDPRVVEALNRDPLIAGEVQPALTVAEMVRADERLRRDFPRITLPLLIIHGTLDAVTKPSGSQLFFEHAGSSDKTLKLYEGGYHDLLNDLDRDLVMADIKTWLDARLPPQSAPEPKP